MVRSSLGVRLGRVSSGEPWVQGRLWPLRWVLGQGSLLPLSQGEAFTLACISYLAILGKYILAKKKKKTKKKHLSNVFPPWELESLSLSPSFFLWTTHRHRHRHTHTHTHTHTQHTTHTHKYIFPQSFSGFLSIFRKRKTHTHTHTHTPKNSLVMFSFLSFCGILPCRLLWRLLSVCLFAFVFVLRKLLLHCRYKGYNANKIPNTEYRLTRLTLVCEVIKYRFVQVRQNLKKRLKRIASDRLGDLVPQVRARFLQGFHDMALLGLCLELSLKFQFASFVQSQF